MASAGRTALIAAMPFGPSTLAGKNFSADAPQAIAMKASVAVKTPGMVTMPKCSARCITAGSMLGLTSNRPPALSSSSTCDGFSTVPAPTSAAAGSDFGQQLDRAERVGRVQRHFDRLDAGLEDGRADGQRLVGAQAAQDGDQIAAERRKGSGSSAPPLSVQPQPLGRLEQA